MRADITLSRSLFLIPFDHYNIICVDRAWMYSCNKDYLDYIERYVLLFREYMMLELAVTNFIFLIFLNKFAQYNYFSVNIKLKRTESTGQFLFKRKSVFYLDFFGSLCVKFTKTHCKRMTMRWTERERGRGRDKNGLSLSLNDERKDTHVSYITLHPVCIVKIARNNFLFQANSMKCFDLRARISVYVCL